MELHKKLALKIQLEADETRLVKQIKLIDDKVSTVRTTNYSDINVQGGEHLNTTERLILEMCDMQDDLEFVRKQLAIINEDIETTEKSVQQRGEEYKKIYQLKREGMKIDGIAIELSMSERTVKNKLEEIGLVSKRK